MRICVRKIYLLQQLYRNTVLKKLNKYNINLNTDGINRIILMLNKSIREQLALSIK